MSASLSMFVCVCVGEREALVTNGNLSVSFTELTKKAK